jgi:hypothetical protein
MNIAKSTEHRSIESFSTVIITDQKLYRELMALRLDDGFVPRLLRESGWSITTCHRVIEEYKRFLFLHRTATHRVVPSKMVDRVWHLHLLYTRSYWDELCGGILQAPLHHHPGNNLVDQHDYFWKNYEATLKSYELIFHHSPPSDIWISPELQFTPRVPATTSATTSATIDSTTTYWQIPKPSIAPIKSVFRSVVARFSKIRLRPSHYATIALLSFVAAVFVFRIDMLLVIPAMWQMGNSIGFVPLLKYACLVSAVISFIQFIPKTYKVILMANRIQKQPLRVNPTSLLEYDIMKPEVALLTKIHANARNKMDFSIVAAVLALCIQICQLVDPSYLVTASPIGLVFAVILCTIVLGFSLSNPLAEFIEKMILIQLRMLRKVTLPKSFSVKYHLQNINSSRVQVCKSCSEPIETLEIDIEKFLTKKDAFAKRLNSVDVLYRTQHCKQCSPSPSQENLNIRLVPKNNYYQCPKCDTIARKKTITTTERATTYSTGLELIVEECAYCHDRQEDTRIIEREVEASCGDYCY